MVFHKKKSNVLSVPAVTHKTNMPTTHPEEKSAITESISAPGASLISVMVHWGILPQLSSHHFGGQMIDRRHQLSHSKLAFRCIAKWCS